METLPQPVHPLDQFLIFPYAPRGQDVKTQDGEIKDAPQGDGARCKMRQVHKIHDQQHHGQENAQVSEFELKLAVVEQKNGNEGNDAGKHCNDGQPYRGGGIEVGKNRGRCNTGGVGGISSTSNNPVTAEKRELECNGGKSSGQ